MQREGIRNRAGAIAIRLAVGACVILNPTGAAAASAQNTPAFVASVTAPDTVLFTGSIPGGYGAKMIDFGDGTSGGIPTACSGPGEPPCPLAVIPISQSHRYKAAGTYEALVKDVVRGTIIARTTVTVEGPEIVIDPHAWIAKVSVEPELGRPLAVTLKCGDADGKTCSNPKNKVEWGDGTTARLQMQPGYNCPHNPLIQCAGPYFYATHTYGKPGTYTVIVKNPDYDPPCGPLEDCPNPIVGTATVTVGQLIDR